MGKYKKCPRCELNYILQDEDMCDVCKAELGLESKLVLLDDIIDEDEPLKLCPICKTSYIGMDENMCENCLANYKRNEDSELDEDNDDWRTYLDDDDTEDAQDDVIPLEELENDEDFGDDFEDEENPDDEPDDYPEDIIDDFDVSYDDDDDVEEDEDEDDEAEEE